MKYVGLIGLSVVAATFIMSGCGDDSSSGPSAPADLTSLTEVNVSSVQNAIAFLGWFSPMSASAPKTKAAEQIAAIKTEIATKIATIKDSGGDSYSYTYDCSISGTWGYSYKSTYDYKTDGSWTETYTSTYQANNCVDNYSGTVNSEPVNRYFQNGNNSYSRSATYNSDANMSNETWQWSDNYSYGYDNNGTKTSRTYTYQSNGNETWSADGEYFDATGNPSFTDTWNYVGTRKRVDVNSSGAVNGGERDVFNEHNTWSGTQDGNYGKRTMHGFYAEYSTDSAGVETITGGEYFDNFVMEYTTSGNETNATISGKAGSLCLGGSMNFSTSPIIQQNQVDYMNDLNNTGGDVLPYAGVLTMKGDGGTGTVTFAADATMHTSATVVAPDGNATFGRWSTLAVGACD